MKLLRDPMYCFCVLSVYSYPIFTVLAAAILLFHAYWWFSYDSSDQEFAQERISTRSFALTSNAKHIKIHFKFFSVYLFPIIALTKSKFAWTCINTAIWAFKINMITFFKSKLDRKSTLRACPERCQTADRQNRFFPNPCQVYPGQNAGYDMTFQMRYL